MCFVTSSIIVGQGGCGLSCVHNGSSGGGSDPGLYPGLVWHQHPPSVAAVHALSCFLHLLQHSILLLHRCRHTFRGLITHQAGQETFLVAQHMHTHTPHTHAQHTHMHNTHTQAHTTHTTHMAAKTHTLMAHSTHSAVHLQVRTVPLSPWLESLAL